jgi:hypothetical protein
MRGLLVKKKINWRPAYMRKSRLSMLFGLIKIRSLIILCIFLWPCTAPAQAGHAGDTSFNSIKRNHFKFVNALIGLCVNQGALGPRYFDVNNSTAYRINIHAYSYNMLSVLLAGNYLSKAYVGYMNNSSQLLSLRKSYPLISNAPNPFMDQPCDLRLTYFSVDLKPQISFFQKKILTLNIAAGARFNFLVNYKYNLSVRNDYVEDYIIPNLKNRYLNYFYNVGLCYNFRSHSSAIICEFEMNHDNKKYFTDWKSGAAASLPIQWQQEWGGKFSCLLFCIGYKYNL